MKWVLVGSWNNVLNRIDLGKRTNLRNFNPVDRIVYSSESPITEQEEDRMSDMLIDSGQLVLLTQKRRTRVFLSSRWRTIRVLVLCDTRIEFLVYEDRFTIPKIVGESLTLSDRL